MLNKQSNDTVSELADFKFALEASSIVAITDQRGEITYANDKFCRLSKYSEEELIGQDHRIINSGHHPPEFFEDLWQTIEAGNVWQGEIKNRGKDGSTYWVDTTVVPFLDENGKPYQYLAIRHEITKRKEFEDELKVMMTRIMEVQEEERKLLSRELHDSLGQNLYSHQITINRLKAEMNHPLLDQMETETVEMMKEVRGMSWELRPSVLDDLGLIPAIRSYIQYFNDYYWITTDFDSSLTQRLRREEETAIYRIIQEAMTNTRKYAETSEIVITIRELDENVRVTIKDEGKGFDMDNVVRSVGLFSMEERARAVGGEITISSNPGSGTTIILDIPV
ncbi:MAG TPA: PAS domain-containing protein [Virgibacillus sp.]|nr:PAS domain-containing protein [Virgibacillus sp.]HLR66002.1 PAS domain-containing protein [Virgibacillus sp.]